MEAQYGAGVTANLQLGVCSQIRIRLRPLFILLLILFAGTTTAQISYESGYYTDNAGVRVPCLIRNADWRENPSYVRCRMSKDGPEQKKTIQDIREFGIDGVVQFIRAEVQMDQSSDVPAELSSESAPDFRSRVVFLKVLLQGEASLYSHVGGDRTRFFYALKQGPIQQLIYKRYLNGLDIMTNNGFKQQLWDSLNCPDTDISTIEKLQYRENDLLDYFLAYHRCKGQTAIVYQRASRQRFCIRITGGFNRSTLSVANSQFNTRNAVFDAQIGFRAGAEFEYILPFNKNKWALSLEPSYQYFRGKRVLNNETASIDFRSIEFPLGLRYYLFLNKQTQLFANAQYIPSYSLNFNSMVIYTKAQDLTVKPKSSFSFGAGGRYGRFSAECRLYPKRELLGNYLFWSGNYQRIALIAGYTLLKVRK